MQKAAREIISIARDEGLDNPHIEQGRGRHPKLYGTVGGKPIKLPVSITKAFATPRWQCATKLSIRRAVEEARA